jgi:hypothetical protein
MVYTLFESIIGNKVLEERLQRAGGKRHRKQQQAFAQLERESRSPEAQKRKYDDMAIDFTTNTPTPQESYERSRPQTPSALRTEAMQPPGRQNMGNDTFMGGTNSRPHTRPATPFNPSFSVPATPPDLYLVTRNSPNISQSLWENFQPDQLFPESSSMPPFPSLSPTQTHQSLDHALANSMPPNNMATTPGNVNQFQQRGQGNGLLQPGMHGFQGQTNMWQPNFDGTLHDGQSPDSWSTGSAQGQAVPATLNVEDWYARRRRRQ